MSNFFFTYILQSEKDLKHYVGWTNNIKKRLIKHNLGKVKSTKDRRPFKLIYFEACLSKDNAILREKALKTGFGRHYLKNRLK